MLGESVGPSLLRECSTLRGELMETIRVRGESKTDRYEELLPQLDALVRDEDDSIANLANIASALAMTFPEFLWVGFYLMKGTELVLGPFQGSVACTRIHLGRGVCGLSAARRESIIVDDVEKFPGHIVCDPASRSEIVVPMFDDRGLHGVLDVDSKTVSAFDITDQRYLERIVDAIILPKLNGTNGARA